MEIKRYAKFLSSVHQHYQFKDWIEQVEKECPKIPVFDPKEDAHELEAWAYWSGMKEGYKLLASYLGVKLGS